MKRTLTIPILLPKCISYRFGIINLLSNQNLSTKKVFIMLLYGKMVDWSSKLLMTCFFMMNRSRKYIHHHIISRIMYGCIFYLKHGQSVKEVINNCNRLNHLILLEHFLILIGKLSTLFCKIFNNLFLT